MSIHPLIIAISIGNIDFRHAYSRLIRRTNKFHIVAHVIKSHIKLHRCQHRGIHSKSRSNVCRRLREFRFIKAKRHPFTSFINSVIFLFRSYKGDAFNRITFFSTCFHNKRQGVVNDRESRLIMIASRIHILDHFTFVRNVIRAIHRLFQHDISMEFRIIQHRRIIFHCRKDKRHTRNVGVCTRRRPITKGSRSISIFFIKCRIINKRIAVPIRKSRHILSIPFLEN